jgi:2-polyprenyl-3-methyl-5-hydroxy-6-metoxy-1,4-benzoquinol methylase
MTKEINNNHIEEEEVLFEKMLQARDRGDRNAVEWEKSKEDFWGVVKNDLKNKKATILNIGCGYDASFVELENLGSVVINMDIIESSLRYLQDKHNAKNCVLGDINNLQFDKESMDVVTCIDILHHEGKNLKKILESIHVSLKKGGSLYIQDINAWGIFQFYKSILLPKFLHKILRKLYHKIKRTEHAPADYEFPTSPLVMKKKLVEAGFQNIKFYKNSAYPESCKIKRAIYNFCKIDYMEKFHNYHYIVKAEK